MRSVPRGLALTALAIVALPLAAPAQQRNSQAALVGRRWQIEKRLESIAVIDRSVMVPMRDGKRMLAVVGGATSPAWLRSPTPRRAAAPWGPRVRPLEPVRVRPCTPPGPRGPEAALRVPRPRRPGFSLRSRVACRQGPALRNLAGLPLDLGVSRRQRRTRGLAPRVYKVTFQPIDFSNYFFAGHRLRLEISSGNFARLDRNLNTGGRNFYESAGVVAHNAVHYDAAHPSAISITVVPHPR